jgi:hypothetical protein
MSAAPCRTVLTSSGCALPLWVLWVTLTRSAGATAGASAHQEHVTALQGERRAEVSGDPFQQHSVAHAGRWLAGHRLGTGMC